jgi:hypothetical protein
VTPTTTEGLAVNALMPFVEAVEEAGGALLGFDHDDAVVEPVGGAAARAVGAGGHPDLPWTGPQAAG